MSFDISKLESEVPHDWIKVAQLVAAYVQHDERKPTAAEWLRPVQAAVYLQTTECALRGYRSRLEGPKFTRRGNNVRYKISDLDAWMSEACVNG